MGTVKVVRWFFLFSLLSTLCFADSQVRIVRLSSVDGDVRVDRNLGQGFERAFLNLPITEGMKLQTGRDGRAEVEFEDGSVVRLAPGSVAEFSHLALKDSGAKTSEFKLQQGTAYVDFRGNDEFTLDFGRETISPKDPAHFRVRMNDANAVVAVFKGKIKVDGDSGSVDVGKNDAVTFDLANRDQYETAKLEELPFDTWDKEQGKYHDAYFNKNHDQVQGGYGVSDLNYYGTFINAPGYGSVWQPYFVNAGWNPYMDGMWAYYPGSGYAWVSAYPWGWTPFHCGSWLFGQSFGWGWQPGGCMNGFGFVPVIGAPGNFQRPIPPTGTPGRGTIVMGPRPIFTAPCTHAPRRDSEQFSWIGNSPRKYSRYVASVLAGEAEWLGYYEFQSDSDRGSSRQFQQPGMPRTSSVLRGSSPRPSEQSATNCASTGNARSAFFRWWTLAPRGVPRR